MRFFNHTFLGIVVQFEDDNLPFHVVIETVNVPEHDPDLFTTVGSIAMHLNDASNGSANTKHESPFQVKSSRFGCRTRQITLMKRK